MGLISPPKWPSVNPFSHPLDSKIGRKPMVNPSKWANLKSNFLKFHHRNQVILGIEKARKMAYFRAFLALLSCRLSLAELGSAAGSLQTVFILFAGRIQRRMACSRLSKPSALFGVNTPVKASPSELRMKQSCLSLATSLGNVSR